VIRWRQGLPSLIIRQECRIIPSSRELKIILGKSGHEGSRVARNMRQEGVSKEEALASQHCIGCRIEAKATMESLRFNPCVHDSKRFAQHSRFKKNSVGSSTYDLLVRDLPEIGIFLFQVVAFLFCISGCPSGS
jgi:hypothetical protein